ncbi:MAG: PAS domain-containing protein, partial [Archangium sp.]
MASLFASDSPYLAPTWARYGLALLAAGLAFSLQWLLWRELGPFPSFLFLAALMTWGGARVRTSLQEAQAARAFAQAQGHALAITLRSIGDAVITTGPDGLVCFINPVAAYFTGWREPEAIGQPLERVLRLVDPATREPMAPQLVERDEVRPVQLGHPALLLSRSGAELPIEHTAAPLSGPEGHRLGTVIVFRDISARFREDRERAQLLAREHDAHLEAEAQRERLETLFMQAPVAICLTRGEDH